MGHGGQLHILRDNDLFLLLLSLSLPLSLEIDNFKVLLMDAISAFFSAVIKEFIGAHPPRSLSLCTSSAATEGQCCAFYALELYYIFIY